MGMLAGQMTSRKTEVNELGAQVHRHDQRMNETERQLEDIAAGRRSGSGIASSVGSSEPHPEPARTGQLQHPPKHQRTVLVVGGFPYDTEREQICATLRDIFWTRTRGQRMVNTRESGVNRQSMLCLERGRLAFLRKFKGQKFARGSDECHWHSCCREGLSHTGSGNGHRRRLGTWPSVVQKIE